MPAPDGPQFDSLYHGTGGGIEGGVVRPTEGVLGTGAYATTNYYNAAHYALTKQQDEGKLFGTVYEVEPTSGLTLPSDSNSMIAEMVAKSNPDYKVDPQGLRVKKVAGYPSLYHRSSRTARNVLRSDQKDDDPY
jgi:hypothetical protein